MKSKRCLTAALAAALAFSLAVPSAGAATFTDMSGTYAWAAEYAEDLAAKGVVNGKGDGRFDPSGAVTAVEVFAFCARMLQLEGSVESAMETARGAEVKALLPSISSWAVPEVSVCLETGIVTLAELQSLCNSGNISKALAKEDLAMFVARAMQLENQAKSLSAYALDYTDSSSIRDNRKVYVYLLDSYGVVQGNDQKQFQPRSAVNRAVMATMISRAMKVMADQDIVIDLPDYSNYDWTAGTVASVTNNANGTVALTLNSEITGEAALTVPADVAVYLNNVGCTLEEVTDGRYAKVELDSRGTPTAIYLTTGLTTYTGTVTSVKDAQVAMTVNGSARTFALNRCTQVKVGNTAGTVDLIDADGGYDSATVRVDGAGHVVALQLTGGTRKAEGLIGSVSTGTAGTQLNLTAFDGTTTALPLASNAVVTINGLSGTLGTSYTGNYAQVTVDNDTATVTSVAVNTSTTYVQGYIKSISYNKSETDSLTVVRFSDGQTATYPIADNVAVTYQGASIKFNELTSNRLVTIQLNNQDRAAAIYSYPGSVTTEGTLTAIQFDVVTILTVTKDDGTAVTFQLDMNDLPTFTRDGKSSTVDRLTVGDQVSVTVRYNEVTQITSTSQSATASGTVASISSDLNGTTLVVRLNTGETKAYNVSASVVVTRDDRTVNLLTIQPGDSVDLVISGEELVSITITAASTSSTELNGTAIYVNTSDQTIFLKLEDSSLVTVEVPSSCRIVDTAGTSLTLKSLPAGAQLQVFGSYNSGTFTATLILRK